MSYPEKFIIGIDQSTSATKVVLFDTAGNLVDKTSRDHEQIYPQAGWVEHDAEKIWNNLLAAVEELIDRDRERLSQVVGVSIANQRETYVVFDRATGRPLHHAIVWQCRRGAPLCEELTRAGHGELVESRTGLKLDTYFPASKITWLLREKPEIAEGLRSGQALLGTIDTYLIYRLTGGKTFATDHTNASRTLLYDVHKLCWDAELCDLFSVPPQALAEVRSCDAAFGETDFDGLFESPLPIRGVMGDSQASLFAQRCYEPGQGKATFGTGTSILVNVGEKSDLASKGTVLALAWVLGGKPTYALEGIINYSSATIAWLRDQLGLLTDAAESETLAESVPDNGGVYLVPAFSGLSAPYWDPEARAAILGMSGHTTRAHVVRAALESISYQIRDCLDMIARETGITPQTMHADGGPTQNKFLMQFTADITQLSWEVSAIPESSALGAALAGMLGLGIHNSQGELVGFQREQHSYLPSMLGEQTRSLQLKWHGAVGRVLSQTDS